MYEIKKYNNFSKKLKEHLPKLKPNEKIKFQLNGIYIDKITRKLVCPNSFAVLPTDRIYDPWGGDDGKGDYIDVAYISGERPAKADSSRDSIVTFGKIQFKAVTAGVIEIIGGRLDQEKLLALLFFNNRNTTNVGKPWFVKPVGKGIFHQIETTKKAVATLQGELLIDKAKDVISAMTPEEVDAAAAGLMPSKYHSQTPEQRILGLRAIAVKDANKIIGLSKDVEVKTTAFIEECLKAHVIELDKAKGQFIYPDDKTMICTIKAGQTPHNSLKRYFQTDDGIEVLVSLEKQLALSKASKKEKTTQAVV